jgi:hypothetical protein
MFTFEAECSKLLLLRLVRLLPLRILGLLQSEDLLDRRLLERLGHVVVLIQILRSVSQELPSCGYAQTYNFSK